MGVAVGLFMYDVVVKSSCSLSHEFLNIPAKFCNLRKIKEVQSFNKTFSRAMKNLKNVTKFMKQEDGNVELQLAAFLHYSYLFLLNTSNLCRCYYLCFPRRRSKMSASRGVVINGDNDKRETYKKAIQIVCLCLAWYVTSSANSVVGKIVLSDFPYPMTLSMVQLASISVYLIPVMKAWKVPSTKPSEIPLKYWFQMIIPLAFGKFFASVSSHVSIWKVPVSYAHTGCLH